jgi:hypothetical protein
MFKKNKQRQKQRQKQAQVVNINIGTAKPARKTRSGKGSGGKGNTPPPPPMGYVSYSPSLQQMNRLISSPEIQPYGQKTLHQLGVNRNEQGTQAGVSVPTWWNNPQQNEYGRPINLLDNLANVSNKSVNSVSIHDDIDDIVQSERSLEIQHYYPSSASYASSPASLASYPTDVINGSQQGDEAVSAQAASSGAEEIKELSVAEQKEEAIPAASNVNDVLMSNARELQRNEEFVRRQNEAIRRRREAEAEQKAEQKALTEQLIAEGVLPRRRGKGKKNKL